MNTTVYVANLLPIDAARIAQSLDLSGTTYDALGFGAWGVEPVTIIELGGVEPVPLSSFLQRLFEECPDEEAFYITANGIGATVRRKERSIPCTD